MCCKMSQNLISFFVTCALLTFFIELALNKTFEFPTNLSRLKSAMLMDPMEYLATWSSGPP